MGAVSQGSLGGRSPCLQGQTAGDILLQFSLSVYLPFLSLCPFTAVSPQREQLVPPAVTHVAGQTSSHCLHPPAPLPERWCWLAARTAAAFCAVTASCHQLCSHLPQSLLPTPWSNPPTLDAQVDGSLGCRCMLWIGAFFFSSGYGRPNSCKSKEREKKGTIHTIMILTSPQNCIFHCSVTISTIWVSCVEY